MDAYRLRSFLLVALLASIGLSCSFVTSLFSAGGGQDLFRDDFSGGDSTWGTGTDSESSTGYLDGGLQMKVFKDNYFTWSNPGNDIYQNVHVEVTARNPSSAGSPGFGILCDQQSAGNSYYFFAVTATGDYVIGRSEEGQQDVFLTNDHKWGSSSLIEKDASSYRVGADCGSGLLTLYVNGRKIASAADTAYSAGGVGLFLWSGDQPSAEVTYDDFVLRQLK